MNRPGPAFPDFYRYDELTAELTWRDRWHVSVSYSPNTSRYAPVLWASVERQRVWI